MSEREELVKRLRDRAESQRKHAEGWNKRLAFTEALNAEILAKALDDAADYIAALSAQPQGRCVAFPCKCDASNQQRCAYWQEAQPQGEPVAWCLRSYGILLYHEGGTNKAEVERNLLANFDRDDAELIPLYTHPTPSPSGVREAVEAAPQSEQTHVRVPVEDALELSYWRFEARRKGYSDWKDEPQSERDAFKSEFRALLRAATGKESE